MLDLLEMTTWCSIGQVRLKDGCYLVLTEGLVWYCIGGLKDACDT